MANVLLPNNALKTYQYAFQSCAGNSSKIQAMLEDLLESDFEAGFAVIYDLELSGCFARDRNLVIGVVSALRNYRFSLNHDILPVRIYDIMEKALNRELTSEIPDIESHRLFFRELVDFIAGSKRFNDIIFLIKLHTKIPTKYVPLLQVVIARRYSYTEPEKELIKQEVLAVQRIIRERILPSSDKKVWEDHLQRLMSLTYIDNNVFLIRIHKIGEDLKRRWNILKIKSNIYGGLITILGVIVSLLLFIFAPSEAKLFSLLVLVAMIVWFWKITN